MQNDLRAELIKQFPAEVVEMQDMAGEAYYICPTCKRAVALKNEKCESCGQVLGWNSIRKSQAVNGLRTATLRFEVASDFTKGDCRKCPLSYIAKDNNESIYQCPLKMRSNCKLEIS
ncbi:MAG: hypothetical protein J6J86_08735 [Lachnospiraceae bacterium]|nr:hypothetical protein [Lachnospiraceae bacterium]